MKILVLCFLLFTPTSLALNFKINSYFYDDTLLEMRYAKKMKAT